VFAALPEPVLKAGPPNLSTISAFSGSVLEVAEMVFYRSYI
jgi:hypothetical protein